MAGPAVSETQAEDDDGLPADFETFLEVSETRECDNCKNLFKPRYIEDGLCMGCRYSTDDSDNLVTDGGHRHNTDGLDGHLVVECPDDEAHLSADVETTNYSQTPSELVWLDECPACGAELAYIEETQPTEVLE
ncbi:hypothetical protein JT689_01525 (plasmid) [Halobacterium sp. GSL-19]|uniref:hypothetical protein n=1 Tax=Halobacterium sp. GSL-19 TaxID=2812551 RepID=UPI0019634A0F|nr:hypothetical protein [Halobacterium sp. GSL-19]QRY21770.1 hypothetical protein JT689_01525 [Halobacterium sp. GSL-19]